MSSDDFESLNTFFMKRRLGLSRLGYVQFFFPILLFPDSLFCLLITSYFLINYGSKVVLIFAYTLSFVTLSVQLFKRFLDMGPCSKDLNFGFY